MDNATIAYKDSCATCTGNWSIAGIRALAEQPLDANLPAAVTEINASDITRMDSAGAWMLSKYIAILRRNGHEVSITGLHHEHKALLKLVTAQHPRMASVPERRKRRDFIYKLGENTVELFQEFINLSGFLGEFCLAFLSILGKPSKLQWRSFLINIEQSGYNALPIVGLLTFLIGDVVAYQMGIQLKYYGANIFIVNAAGTSVLREFAPLTTAIILAGRTSAAFTAQIGTMKVNEEIDALRIMGISPIERLVVPKVMGLIIAVPLLTMWANVFGVLGSMITAHMTLDINFYDFLARFDNVITLESFVFGLVKAPVFALIVALIGCFQGFQVEGSAESVGHRTTVSVVQAIFLIIVVDAIFSIMYKFGNGG